MMKFSIGDRVRDRSDGYGIVCSAADAVAAGEWEDTDLSRNNICVRFDSSLSGHHYFEDHVDNLVLIEPAKPTVRIEGNELILEES